MKTFFFIFLQEPNIDIALENFLNSNKHIFRYFILQQSNIIFHSLFADNQEIHS